MEARSVRFAAAARSVGEVARARGLLVPGFRSPPRDPRLDRMVRRGTEPVISVRIRGRPWAAVLADMIEGVVVANELDAVAASACRAALWDRLDPQRLAVVATAAEADPFAPAPTGDEATAPTTETAAA